MVVIDDACKVVSCSGKFNNAKSATKMAEDLTVVTNEGKIDKHSSTTAISNAKDVACSVWEII